MAAAVPATAEGVIMITNFKSFAVIAWKTLVLVAFLRTIKAIIQIIIAALQPMQHSAIVITDRLLGEELKCFDVRLVHYDFLR